MASPRETPGRCNHYLGSGIGYCDQDEPVRAETCAAGHSRRSQRRPLADVLPLEVASFVDDPNRPFWRVVRTRGRYDVRRCDMFDEGLHDSSESFVGHRYDSEAAATEERDRLVLASSGTLRVDDLARPASPKATALTLLVKVGEPGDGTWDSGDCAPATNRFIYDAFVEAVEEHGIDIAASGEPRPSQFSEPKADDGPQFIEAEVVTGDGRRFTLFGRLPTQIGELAALLADSEFSMASAWRDFRERAAFRGL